MPIVILVGQSHFTRSRKSQMVCLDAQTCPDQRQEMILKGKSRPGSAWIVTFRICDHLDGLSRSASWRRRHAESFDLDSSIHTCGTGVINQNPEESLEGLTGCRSQSKVPLSLALHLKRSPSAYKVSCTVKSTLISCHDKLD